MSPTLLEQIANGDSQAVEMFLDRYGGLVWSLARRFCPEASEAEDAVQEIFVEIWRSAGRYNPEVASEATFVAMIARRRLIDRQRRHARGPDVHRLVDGAHAGAAPGEAPTQVRDDAALAAEKFELLSPDQQRVLRLSIYHGLSHEKISESTGIPLGTVKTHVRRGLIKLRDLLDNAGVDSRTGAAS